jgi:hypothetical protein
MSKIEEKGQSITAILSGLPLYIATCFDFYQKPSSGIYKTTA